MALIDDIDVLNVADTSGNWTTSLFDSPTDNNSSSTVPIFIEDDTAQEWKLKKSQTLGSTFTATISGTPSMTNRIVVGMLGYPFAELGNIPISAFFFRISSSTGFTTNYGQWDALAQLFAPLNVPISNMTPIMGYEDSTDSTSGTPDFGSIESVGWLATSGGTNDGKQGGFDFMFVIGYLGAHSQTFTNTFFSDLKDEYFDSDGGGLPGTANRPTGVLSQSGDFFQTNVNLLLGEGSSDSANIVVDETAKTVFFANLHVNHELGYIFVNPSSSHEIRLILTDCVHFWNDQASGNHIFTDAANVDHFQIVGCSFSNGGQFSLPSDTANRFVRGTKFTNCQAGTISDGEFTDNIVSGGEAVTVSGDADLTGSQILTPVVAANNSGLVWDGNFDPDGNLDDMVFSKTSGTAHHALEFGTGVPTTSMTLRGCAFGTDFSATEDGSVGDETFHFLDTTGTITLNLVNCTGNFGYRTEGVVVTIVADPATTKVTVEEGDGTFIENARVFLETGDAGGAGAFPFQDAVTTLTQTGGTATLTATATHGLITGDIVVIRGAGIQNYNKVATITVTSTTVFTYSVNDNPSSPATGTPVFSYVPISGLTDVNGEIQSSRVWPNTQSVTGWARKSSASPFFKQTPISIADASGGTDLLIALQPDD